MQRNTSRLSLYSSVLLLFIATTLADEIKQPLDHADYDRWNTISTFQLSNDGQWILYTINSGKADGDPTLVIRKNGGVKEYRIVRGRTAKFSFDSKRVIYEIAPDPEQVKKRKKEKAKPEEMPKPALEVLDLQSGESFLAERIKSYSIPEKKGQWLAYLLEPPLKPKSAKELKSDVTETYEITPEGLRLPSKPLKLKKRGEKEPSNHPELAEEQTPEEESTDKPDEKLSEHDDSPEKKKKEPGTVLVVRNLHTKEERRFADVVSYVFSKHGNMLAFATSIDAPEKNKTDAAKESDPSDSGTSTQDGVFVLNLKTQTLNQIISGLGNFKRLSFNETGESLAFVTDSEDYDAKTSSWSLYHWSSPSKQAELIAKEASAGIPEGWWVSSESTPYFSEDGQRLFFFTAPIPEAVHEERANAEDKASNASKEEDEEEKKAKLDIWHWQDPLLQPQQLLEADKEKRRSYTAVFDLNTKEIVQLADKELPSISIDRRSTSDLAAGVSDIPYRKALSWDRPGLQDTWLVNLHTGKRHLILEKSRASGRISPEGEYITWFDPEERQWYASPASPDHAPVNISQGIEFPLQNELHDTPSLPGSYGSAGWLKDDAAFLIYDRFDIWQLDPTGKDAPICLTEGRGREQSIRFRFVQLDKEARSIDPDQDLILSAFNEKTKASGYYVLKPEAIDEASSATSETPTDNSSSRLRQLIMLNESVNGITKARDSNDVAFRRNTFRRCPDIWTSTTDFNTIKRISDINPHQDEYAWGDVELIHWEANDGQLLDGLLYKPDHFDPAKKYPLLVYFYERRSDNLHSYYAPAAGRSIINFSFYVSRGYVLFVPDIPYTTGEPGPSAVNSVLSGTQAVVDLGFIDEERIGMQGHSWGGYQAAYLVTQTDMFACAEAGAPVSNMTSAYGGIRWGSGLSRMFQYERTQSRIGDSLWNARDKYIANSPLFEADKINTPLLILHNDEDGAVPWYQGIELFVAMRRLAKPAWLLNYNGDPHWVMGSENRLDFAIRMQQFFDHYLKDAPEPEWMAVGIPAVEKGENYGLELLEPEPEVE